MNMFGADFARDITGLKRRGRLATAVTWRSSRRAQEHVTKTLENQLKPVTEPLKAGDTN